MCVCGAYVCMCVAHACMCVAHVCVCVCLCVCVCGVCVCVSHVCVCGWGVCVCVCVMCVSLKASRLDEKLIPSYHSGTRAPVALSCFVIRVPVLDSRSFYVHRKGRNSQNSYHG